MPLFRIIFFKVSMTKVGFVLSTENTVWMGEKWKTFFSSSRESESGYEVFPLASLFTSLPFGPLIESFACKRQEMVIASALNTTREEGLLVF